MTPKNPLGALRDLALDALKDPRSTAEKAVDQARGTAALGRMVVGQVGRTAVVTASRAVVSIVATAREDGDASTATNLGSTPTAPADLRPVPSVNEPAHPAADPASQPATAVAVDAPAKQQGDPTAPNPVSPARRATARKTAAKKASTPDPRSTGAKKAATVEPAKKATPGPAGNAADAPSTGAAGEDATAKKTPAKKGPAKKTTKKTAKTTSPSLPVTTPADAGEPPADDDVDATPADVAKVVAKKAPGKKATAKTTAKKATTTPAKKSAAKKTAKKATAKKTPGNDDTLVYTSDSSDGPGADTGDHLEQPPLIDPAAVKAVASEAGIGRRAADPDKG